MTKEERKKETQIKLVKNRPYFSFEPTRKIFLFYFVDYALSSY